MGLCAKEHILCAKGKTYASAAPNGGHLGHNSAPAASYLADWG